MPCDSTVGGWHCVSCKGIDQQYPFVFCNSALLNTTPRSDFLGTGCEHLSDR
jgi:hypothetical protein